MPPPSASIGNVTTADPRKNSPVRIIRKCAIFSENMMDCSSFVSTVDTQITEDAYIITFARQVQSLNLAAHKISILGRTRSTRL